MYHYILLLLFFLTGMALRPVQLLIGEEEDYFNALNEPL